MTSTGTLTAPVDFDLDRPTFEIWLDGNRFASTQVPALAKKLHDRMASAESGQRYGNRTLELRVVNDRRQEARVAGWLEREPDLAR